jgi:hypothetical protein
MTPAIALATWMIEHLTPRPYGEVLAGDLLEELHAGRSTLWYWRQTVTTIVLSALHRSRSYAIPMVFSAAWSLLFPAWQVGLWNSRLARSLFDRGASLDWPLSGIADLSRGVLPVATFICFGLMFYLLLRIHSIPRPSILRLMGSLSLGLNVFLIALITLHHLAGPGGDRPQVATPGVVFQAPFHHFVSIPLTLSLLSAILTALPPSRQRRKAVSL